MIAAPWRDALAAHEPAPVPVEVMEWNGGRKSVLRSFDDFAAACAYVIGLGCWAFELDAEHPGCADAFTRSGLVLAIQPKGFAL